MATEMVLVFPPYNITLEESSLMQVIQLKIAPDRIPGAIRRAVTWKNVFIGDTPRLMEASSTLTSICCKNALPERTVYGSFRTIKAMIIIAAVPVRITGCLLNATIKLIPRTAPGITNGNMISRSISCPASPFCLTTM